MLSFLTKQADALTDPIEAVGNVLDALFTSDKERLDKKAVGGPLSVGCVAWRCFITSSPAI
jgi:hypothetical protein